METDFVNVSFSFPRKNIARKFYTRQYFLHPLVSRARTFLQTLFHRILWVIKSSIDKITSRIEISIPPLPLPRQSSFHGSLLGRDNEILGCGDLLIDQTQNPVCYSVTTSNTGQVWLLFAARSALRWELDSRCHSKHTPRP